MGEAQGFIFRWHRSGAILIHSSEISDQSNNQSIVAESSSFILLKYLIYQTINQSINRSGAILIHSSEISDLTNNQSIN